jgi:hypothetical protein
MNVVAARRTSIAWAVAAVSMLADVLTGLAVGAGAGLLPTGRANPQPPTSSKAAAKLVTLRRDDTAQGYGTCPDAVDLLAPM